LLKTTSICAVISVAELLRRTRMLVQEKFRVLELFFVAALCHLILTTLGDLVQRRREAHLGHSDAGPTTDRHDGAIASPPGNALPSSDPMRRPS
jgi:hypothetical protein